MLLWIALISSHPLPHRHPLSIDRPMSDGDSFVLQSFINQWPSQSVCQVVSSGSRTSRVLGSHTELHYLGHSQSLVGVFAMFFSGCCSTQVAFPSSSPAMCVSLWLCLLFAYKSTTKLGWAAYQCPQADREYNPLPPGYLLPLVVVVSICPHT